MAGHPTRLYLTALAASFGGFCAGTSLAFSSPSGPILTNGTVGTIHLTNEEYGHFSSSVNLGIIIGSLAAGFMMRSLGRRWTMILSAIPYLVGWGLIAGAQNFGWLIGGRLFTGFGAGISIPLVPTYIAEISSSEIRGKLCSIFQVLLTLGIVFAYTLAPLMDSFRWMAVACMAPPIAHAIFLVFAKESPTYLLAKNREDEARETLQYFRENEDVSEEYEGMKKFLQERTKEKKKLKDLLDPSIRKPLLMIVMLFFFFHFSGINPIIFNLNQIFESVNSTLSEKVSPIIVGFILPVFAAVSGFVVDKWGRRILLIISAMLMAISLVALGVYFYEKEYVPDVAEYIGWLPLVSTCSYLATFSVGFGTVPWIILGEIFPPDIREAAASVSNMFAFAFSYITTLIYVPVKDLIGLSGVFWMHGGFCVLALIYCFVFVVETKGKTSQEIAQAFI